MEEKKLSNKQINELKKQLNKLGYNYEMLSNANIKHLTNAYLFFLEEIKEFDDDFSKAIKHNYSIVSFCKRYGITRAALYKNQNGASRHESVINYIISKQNQFESYKKTKIKKYIREKIILM